MPVDPLDSAGARQLVPDLREREVYLCGPTPMMEAVRDGLQLVGIRAARSTSNASSSESSPMPKRAVAAITTALALALLFSFKTPADSASALGAPGLVSLAHRRPRPARWPGPAPALAGPGGSEPPGVTPGAHEGPGQGQRDLHRAVVAEPFGEVQVQITMVAGKITAVTALQLPTHGRSGFISQDAEPILQGEAFPRRARRSTPSRAPRTRATPTPSRSRARSTRPMAECAEQPRPAGPAADRRPRWAR